MTLLIRRRLLVAAMGAFALCSKSVPAWAQYSQMFTREPPQQSYTAPDGAFGVKLPPSWEPRPVKEIPHAVQFRIQGAGDAWMVVRKLPIPEGARARQLLVRSKELRLDKLPHFVESERRDVDFNGVKGASILGTYWYQGNAQFPRAVEEVYLIVGDTAYEFHLECFAPLAARLAEDVNRVYKSFVPNPGTQVKPGTTEQPDDDDENPLDKLPF